MPDDDFTLEASFKCGERVGKFELLTLRSVHGRYGLGADPIGAIAFHAGKPSTWMLIPYFAGFPARALTAEFVICPFRASSRPSLLSYRCSDAGADALGIFENGHAGLTIVINGQVCETGVQLDYSQWQHVALTWDGADGRLALYKDDGQESVGAAIAGEPVRFGAPRYSGALAGGEAIASDGCLVFGQAQQRARDISGFLGDGAFCGSLLRLTIWDRALTRDELNDNRDAPLPERQDGLIGSWHFPQSAYAAREAWNVCAQPANIAQLGGFGEPTVRDVRHMRISAHTGTIACASRRTVPVNRQVHVAAVVERRWSALFDGASYLDFGDRFDLDGDLAIDVDLAVKATDAGMGILSKAGAPGQGYPYAMSLNAARQLVFSFADRDGQVFEMCSTIAVPTGRNRLRVVRRKTEHDTQVHLFVNGRAAGDALVDAEAAKSAGPLTIGCCRCDGEIRFFDGRIFEVRIGAAEYEPVLCWRPFVTAGAPKTYGTVVVAPVPQASTLSLFIDGAPSETVPANPPPPDDAAFFGLGPMSEAHVGWARVWRGRPSPRALAAENAPMEASSALLADYRGVLTPTGELQDGSGSELHLRIDGPCD